MSAAATRTRPAVASSGRVPGPPELLPGRPDAVIDLQTPEGCALIGGQWRYADARVREIDFVELGGPGSGDPLGPGDVPNRTYDIEPHAEAVDFDDSTWMQLAPEETMRRLADGRVCFNWYRIAVTIPERVGELDPTGATVVFEVVVDDYAEVWVDGKMPLALGDSDGQVVAGFNAPNRVDAHPRRTARPALPARRVRHQRADLGVAAQLHLDAHRLARVPPARRETAEIERVAGGFEFTEGPVWSPGWRAAVQLAEHQRDLPPRSASSSGSRCSAPRAATRASTSADTTSPAPTASRSRPTAC